MIDLNNVKRDLKVTGMARKGKAKTPTIILESRDGEKVTLKFDDSSVLEAFKIDQTFTLKLTEGEQTPLLKEK